MGSLLSAVLFHLSQLDLIFSILLGSPRNMLIISSTSGLWTQFLIVVWMSLSGKSIAYDTSGSVSVDCFSSSLWFVLFYFSTFLAILLNPLKFVLLNAVIVSFGCQPDTPGRANLAGEIAFIRLLCGCACGVSSLLIDVGGSSPWQVEPSLGRWPWAVSDNWPQPKASHKQLCGGLRFSFRSGFPPWRTV